MEIIGLVIISATVLTLAFITAGVVRMHKDFVETERTTEYSKVAINENTVGGQIYTITENPNGRTTRKHQNVPKQVNIEVKKRSKNC